MGTAFSGHRIIVSTPKAPPGWTCEIVHNVGDWLSGFWEKLQPDVITETDTTPTELPEGTTVKFEGNEYKLKTFQWEDSTTAIITTVDGERFKLTGVNLFQYGNNFYKPGEMIETGIPFSCDT